MIMLSLSAISALNKPRALPLLPLSISKFHLPFKLSQFLRSNCGFGCSFRGMFILIPILLFFNNKIIAEREIKSSPFIVFFIDLIAFLPIRFFVEINKFIKHIINLQFKIIFL